VLGVQLPGAHQLHAAARTFWRGHSLLLRRGFEPDGDLDQKAPDVPAGYGFDYINADAMITIEGSDGRSYHGQRYELPGSASRPI